VRPLKPGLRVLGRALTLRFLPTREDVAARLEQPEHRHENIHRIAIEAVRPGDVLVIDGRGQTEAGIVGDVLTARVRYLGGAGIVTDGGIRDSAEVKSMDFPVFCGGVHGAISPVLHWASDYNQPIQCGGTLVLPGDIIFGDDDGVVVIPQQLAAEVAARAAEHERMDATSRRHVEAGIPISRAYPLAGDLLEEFRRQLKES